MASIISHLQQIDRQLELLLPVEEILQACRDVGYRFRIRVLNPALTVHLLILQLLAKSSMRGARRVARMQIIRQAVAQAKATLPLQMMLNLVEAVCRRAMSLVERDSDSDWHGHRLVLVDGTSCRVDDTPALRKRYGKASNQRGLSDLDEQAAFHASAQAVAVAADRLSNLPAWVQAHLGLDHHGSAGSQAVPGQFADPVV